MNKVKDQVITDEYALYSGDCMDVLPTIKDESIHFCCYSPPFKNLYTYSSDARDLSNVSSDKEFFTQYAFIVKELARVTKKGRIHAVHCTDLFKINGQLSDFPADIIKLYEQLGFTYMSRITIFKEPLKVRIKTMVQSLMHKFIVEDSTKNYPAMPDYILLFRKKGENEIPVTHEFGLTHYAGATPILPETLGIYNRANKSDFRSTAQLWDYIKTKYKNHKDPKTNKLSHIIWQRYASAVWDDIRVENCLPFNDSKDEDDEKHITPTQLDVIDRLVDLYTNEGEIVLSPFTGVGSDIYCPVSMGRKAIGIELKDSYFKQAKINMKLAKTRFNKSEQKSFF